MDNWSSDHASQYWGAYESVAKFRLLALESSFPTAERSVDTNDAEGSSSIDYHKAFSVHLYNADYYLKVRLPPRSVQNFNPLLQVAGLARTTMWSYLGSDWLSMHRASVRVQITVGVQFCTFALSDFCIETKQPYD